MTAKHTGSYAIETCTDIWRQRSVHASYSEAVTEADKYIRKGCGTSSIRIVPVTLKAVKET